MCKVYGEPGGTRIRVIALSTGFHHPGIYWLAKGTTLGEFAERAGVPDATQKDAFPWAIWVDRGQKPYVGRFKLRDYQLGKLTATIVLENGDDITVSYPEY